MAMPSSFIPARKRIGRKRRGPDQATETPVGPLALVSATYVGGTSVTLTFNQAIDVGALAPDSFGVIDGEFFEQTYVGTSVLSSTADSVTIELLSIDPTSPGHVVLNADAANGIVATNGGEAWDGVSGLVLPFGE